MEDTFVPSQIVFQGPSGTHPISAFLIPTESLVRGTVFAGEYLVTIDLPQWATANGVYTLEYLLLCDADGNEAVYERPELYRTHFPTTFNVHGAMVDREPPTLLDLVLPELVRLTVDPTLAAGMDSSKSRAASTGAAGSGGSGEAGGGDGTGGPGVPGADEKAGGGGGGTTSGSGQRSGASASRENTGGWAGSTVGENDAADAADAAGSSSTEPNQETASLPPPQSNDNTEVVDVTANLTRHIIDVIVEETLSGLAAHENPTFLTGSHLVLESAEAPDIQMFSVHFDSENLVPRSDPAADEAVAKWGEDARVYRLNFSFPEYAWSGIWVVRSTVVSDEVGVNLSISYHHRLLLRTQTRAFRLPFHTAPFWC
jgi:hypothetical protein